MSPSVRLRGVALFATEFPSDITRRGDDREVSISGVVVVHWDLCNHWGMSGFVQVTYCLSFLACRRVLQWRMLDAHQLCIRLSDLGDGDGRS